MSKTTIDRRGALKRIGTSAFGASVLGSGTAAATHEQLDIWIYPNEESDREKAKNEIWNALLHFLDQLLANDVMPAYGLHVYENNTNRTEDDSECDGSTYFNEFKQWIDDNRSDVDNVHIGVTDHTAFANAAGHSKGNSAWNPSTPGKAFVGTEGGYGSGINDKARYKNLAVQEVAHTLITHDYVTDMTEGDEHDLGKLRSFQSSTPMLTFYEDGPNPCGDIGDRSQKGTCKEDVTWDETHDLDVTQCTMDAIEETKNKESGSH